MTPVDTSPMSRLTTTTATSMRFIGSRSSAAATDPRRGRLLRGDLVGAVGGQPGVGLGRAQAGPGVRARIGEHHVDGARKGRCALGRGRRCCCMDVAHRRYSSNGWPTAPTSGALAPRR